MSGPLGFRVSDDENIKSRDQDQRRIGALLVGRSEVRLKVLEHPSEGEETIKKRGGVPVWHYTVKVAQCWLFVDNVA